MEAVDLKIESEGRLEGVQSIKGDLELIFSGGDVVEVEGRDSPFSVFLSLGNFDGIDEGITSRKSRRDLDSAIIIVVR